jgi:hypothetical protein
MARKTSLLVLLMLLAAGIALAQPMSGTYYIKKGVSSADTFPSFYAVGQAVEARGLDGNVTFKAFAGYYDEGICYLRNVVGDTDYTTTFEPQTGQGEVTVYNASYAFYINYTNNVKIKNLTLRASSYCVYSYYSSGTKVEKCNLMGASYGAMMYYAHYDSVVGCQILPTSCGIYFYGTSSARSKHNHASNNMIGGYSSYAIYSYYNDSAEIYYNTFAGPGSYTIYANYATRWRMKDNIFSCIGSYALYMATGCTLDYSDYNDWYPSTYLANYQGTLYSTLAAWQTGTGFDMNSISANPMVGGAGNLHLRTGSPCINAGDPIAGITTDIDGDARSTTTPCIGADEYTTVGSALSGTYYIKPNVTAGDTYPYSTQRPPISRYAGRRPASRSRSSPVRTTKEWT